MSCVSWCGGRLELFGKDDRLFKEFIKGVERDALSFFSAIKPFLISFMNSASNLICMVSRQLLNSSGLTKTATGLPFFVVDDFFMGGINRICQGTQFHFCFRSRKSNHILTSIKVNLYLV